MSVTWRRQADTDGVLDTFKQAYGGMTGGKVSFVTHKPTTLVFSDDEVMHLDAQIQDLKTKLVDTDTDITI